MATNKTVIYEKHVTIVFRTLWLSLEEISIVYRLLNVSQLSLSDALLL